MQIHLNQMLRNHVSSIRQTQKDPRAVGIGVFTKERAYTRDGYAHLSHQDTKIELIHRDRQLSMMRKLLRKERRYKRTWGMLCFVSSSLAFAIYFL